MSDEELRKIANGIAENNRKDQKGKEDIIEKEKQFQNAFSTLIHQLKQRVETLNTVYNDTDKNLLTITETEHGVTITIESKHLQVSIHNEGFSYPVGIVKFSKIYPSPTYSTTAALPFEQIKYMQGKWLINRGQKLTDTTEDFVIHALLNEFGKSI